MNDFNFDLDKYKKNTASQQTLRIYDEGSFIVQILKAEMVPTKKNLLGADNSENLIITFKVLEPANKENIIDIFQIKNSNENVERIGLQKLSILCEECDIPASSNTKELIGKKIKLIIKNKVDKYQNKKSFFFYKRYNEHN